MLPFRLPATLLMNMMNCALYVSVPVFLTAFVCLYRIAKALTAELCVFRVQWFLSVKRMTGRRRRRTKAECDTDAAQENSLDTHTHAHTAAPPHMT